MGNSKFHTLRKLVSPAKYQASQEDPNDDMSMVGRSEVPVCLGADRPPAHLLQSLHGRDVAAATTANNSRSSRNHHKRPSPLTPPRSPPRSATGAATSNPASGSRSCGSPATSAPPDSPLSGYRRSPVPEPIMEVDELEEAEDVSPLRPIDAAAPPPPPAAATSRSRCSLESISEDPTPFEEGEAGDETLPSLTTSSSAASSLAGRPSSEEVVEIRGGVALPSDSGGKDTVPVREPVCGIAF